MPKSSKQFTKRHAMLASSSSLTLQRKSHPLFAFSELVKCADTRITVVVLHIYAIIGHGVVRASASLRLTMLSPKSTASRPSLWYAPLLLNNDQLRVDTKSPPCTAPHPVPSRASMLMSLASLLPSLECPACPRSCSSGGLWLPRESNSACSWQRDDQTHVSQLLCPGGPCAPPNNSCHITHAVAFSPVVAQPLAAAMARSSIRCEAPTSKACATWSHLWPLLDAPLLIQRGPARFVYST